MSADVRQNLGVRLRGINSTSINKNKLIFATCLIVIMAIMWGRILLRNNNSTPTANAQIIDESLQTQGQAAKTKIKYIQLPVVAGRNDVLTINFFSARGWEGFKREGEVEKGDMYSQTSLVSRGEAGTDESERIRQIAQKLQLEAIAMTEKPQAFINNKIVCIGDSVIVKDQMNVYEFRVVTMTRNEISLKCEGIVISLKMVQPNESAD